jgi:hypothetical protein
MRRSDNPVSQVNPNKIRWQRRQEELRRLEEERRDREALRMQERRERMQERREREQGRRERRTAHEIARCYREHTPKQGTPKRSDRTIRRPKKRQRVTVIA